jgi:hypothetical protein
MSTRLVQSDKTASGGCSAGQGSSEPVAPQIYLYYYLFIIYKNPSLLQDLNLRTLGLMTSTLSITLPRQQCHHMFVLC